MKLSILNKKKFPWNEVVAEELEKINSELGQHHKNGKADSLIEEKEKIIGELLSVLWTNDSFTKEFSENRIKKILEINEEIKLSEKEPVVDIALTYLEYISNLNNSRDKLKDIFNLVKKNKINQQQFCMIASDVFELDKTKDEKVKFDLNQFKSPGISTIEYDNSRIYKKCKLEFFKLENIPYDFDLVNISDSLRALPFLMSESCENIIAYPEDILEDLAGPISDKIIEIYCSDDKMCYIEMEDHLGDGCGFRIPKKKDGKVIIHKHIPN